MQTAISLHPGHNDLLRLGSSYEAIMLGNVELMLRQDGLGKVIIPLAEQLASISRHFGQMTRATVLRQSPGDGLLVHHINGANVRYDAAV